MTGHAAQLLVTLSPDGELQVELAGFGPHRRVVKLRDAEAASSLRRMLEAQAEGQAEIGRDGAPTGQQVLHWERHGAWPDSRCRFCIAEGRTRGGKPKRQSRKELVLRTQGVEVRRIKAQAKGPKGPIKSTKSAEDLGL